MSSAAYPALGRQKDERGISLAETLIALAILAAVAVAFLLGLGTAYKAVTIAGQRTALESLAKSQLEAIKACPYDDQVSEGHPDYSSCKITDILSQPQYQGYDVTIQATRLDPKGDGYGNDDGLQKITVTVTYQEGDKQKQFTLEGYKVKP